MIQFNLFGGWKSIAPAVLLAAALVGCAGAGGTPAADTSAQPLTVAESATADSAGAAPAAGEKQPSSAEAVTGEPAVGGAADEDAALALTAPSQLLDSYRMAATFVITSQLPGGVNVASTQVQGVWRRAQGPFGFDAAFTLVNSSGDRREEIALVAIGDDAAVQTGGAWSTIRRDSALPYTDPDSLLSLPFVTRINHGENLGREEVEGVAVTHYRLTDPAVFTSAAQDMLPGDNAIVRDLLLEGWVADAGFVVGYFLQATIDGAEFIDESGARLAVQQQIDAGYTLSDLDAVDAIDWPADAQPPGTISVPGFVPNTFPIPDGGTVTPHLGLLEIRTTQAEADVTAFYRARLAELGWTVSGDSGFYTAAKDGQTLSITILPDEAGGETIVRVFAAAE